MGGRINKVQRAMLLFAGITLGASGIAAKEKPSAIALLQQKDTGGDYETFACTPKSETDDIFFISCGGIY